MKSVTGLMTEYFDSGTQLLRESTEVPIKPSKSEWELLSNPERMSRTYEFAGKTDSMVFFVQELLLFQEELGHHAKLTIEKDSVSVEVYTHGVERVTNLDKEFVREADKIFTDAGEINGRV